MDLMLNLSMDPLPRRKKQISNLNNETKMDSKSTDISENMSEEIAKDNDNIKLNLKKSSKSNLNSNPNNKSDKIKNDIYNNVKKNVSTVNNNTEKTKIRQKSTLDLNEDANIKDMEVFLSSTSGVYSEPIFSDKSFTKYTDLHPHLIKTLSQRMNINVSTAIQEKAIPPLITGKDVLIKSATGSGKTLSFAIPLINSLQAIQPNINRESGIYAIVISPTQELAVQTHEVMVKLTNPFVRIVSGILIGGVKSLSQKRALRKGLNILIVTPNRLLYHMNNTGLKIDNLQWLVIDEADRMTEMGFGDSIQKILIEISKVRNLNSIQTVLVSATLTTGVENLAGLALKDPVRAEVEIVGKTEDKPKDIFVMPTGLQHYLLVCPTKLRMVALLSFLLLKCKYGKHTGKVVVFMATQDLVEYHFQVFNVFLKNKSLLQELPNTEKTGMNQKSDINIYQLHGGMEHDKRQSVFKEFSACNNGFLLTTDLCSRGLDMTGINWVVQYHPPGNPIDYIHRVGRTARAGSKGKALLFLQPSEVNYISHLQESMGGINIQKVSLMSVMQTALHHAGTLKVKKSVHTVEESIFLTAKLLEEHVSQDTMLQNLGRCAFKSLVRGYACFSKEMRQFFCYRDLHLGHVAKSLACTETPKQISQSCQRNVESDLPIDKRKKIESKKLKRKNDRSDEKKPLKLKKVDQAHRNMLAEYGL